MKNIHIITHRGLDPARKPYFKESSLEAFTDQLGRGYGLEFDIWVTADGRLLAAHDARTVGYAPPVTSVLHAIQEKSAPGTISAMHVKYASQSRKGIELVLTALKGFDLDRLLIFDTTLETARYLKAANPRLHLAPSVAHPYDIARYNGATGGTLYSVQEVLANRDLFDWVWLDEWDLADESGVSKTLYNQATFAAMRNAGLKIALVTPELHGTSPGLLGGEAHPDAATPERLHARFAEILALRPDAVCTDWPDFVRDLSRLVISS